MSDCESRLPPDFYAHLTSDDRPDIYNIFWFIGAICLVITAIIIIPRLHQIYKDAVCIRKDFEHILLPFSHIICLLIVAFPLVAAFLKFQVFLSPTNGYTNEFILHSYEGLILYLFTQLLIMFLGTFKAAMTAFQHAPATKFYSVPPLGCCFKLCTKPKRMTAKDFRRLYYLILQFAFLAPIISYSNLLRSFAKQKSVLLYLEIIQSISSMLCIYALIALLKASHTVLHSFNIHGKFICIKSMIGCILLPPIICAYVVNGHDQTKYTSDVMTDAWSSMITMLFLPFVSFGFRKYFTPKDAKKAMKNATNESYIASRYETLVDQQVNTTNANYALMQNEFEAQIQ